MTENKLLAPCLKLMRTELNDFVILKHADGYTSGVPDVSVSGRGFTTWWEFKHGPAIKWENALQKRTCQKLAALGTACFVVLYEESAYTRRTVILSPDDVEVAATAGFDHQFIVNFVRTIHDQ